MTQDDIIEILGRLGYTDVRLDCMLVYLREWARRKAIIECGTITKEDVVIASMLFDGFNRRKAK